MPPQEPTDNPQPQDLTSLESSVSLLEYRMNTHKHNLVDLTQPVNDDKPVTLLDATSVTVDATRGRFFSITLKGNRTLANPTGAYDGQRFVFEIIQDGTGSRTLAFGSKFAFGVTLASITLTTTANARDFIGAIYRQTTDKFYIVAFADGY